MHNVSIRWTHRNGQPVRFMGCEHLHHRLADPRQIADQRNRRGTSESASHISSNTECSDETDREALQTSSQLASTLSMSPDSYPNM